MIYIHERIFYNRENIGCFVVRNEKLGFVKYIWFGRAQFYSFILKPCIEKWIDFDLLLVLVIQSLQTMKWCQQILFHRLEKYTPLNHKKVWNVQILLQQAQFIALKLPDTFYRSFWWALLLPIKCAWS